MDRKKIIKKYEAFVDKYECFSSSDDYVLEMHKAVLALLKEQDETIKELRNAYGYLQKQFFEAQDKLLKEQEAVVRCKDCKHWDKTTLEEGNDCISGLWEDAVCDMFRDWDSYGDLGENFRRTNGDWFCADGERR